MRSNIPHKRNRERVERKLRADFRPGTIEDLRGGMGDIESFHLYVSDGLRCLDKRQRRRRLRIWKKVDG